MAEVGQEGGVGGEEARVLDGCVQALEGGGGEVPAAAGWDPPGDGLGEKGFHVDLEGWRKGGFRV